MAEWMDGQWVEVTLDREDYTEEQWRKIVELVEFCEKKAAELGTTAKEEQAYCYLIGAQELGPWSENG